jgi:antitoxin component YwqK of YwqJK toxin-antitoxin module
LAIGLLAAHFVSLSDYLTGIKFLIKNLCFIFFSQIEIPIKNSKKTNSYSLTSGGVKKVWNDKGQLFSLTNLDDRLLENGLSLTFFPETGAILSRGNFVEGKREGIWEWYFPDGKLYYRSGYSPYKQRQVWISTNLLGNEHGIHERFYENGQLEEKGFLYTQNITGDTQKIINNIIKTCKI